MNLIEQFKATRRAAVPIVGIETVDQQGTIKSIITEVTNGTTPTAQWDIIRGLTPVNTEGRSLCSMINGDMEPAMATGNPAECLSKLANSDAIPERTIIFFHNAHRFIDNESVAQGICNLRDLYKAIPATLVLLAPYLSLPTELEHDVIILTEPLPTMDEIKSIVTSTTQDAGIKKVDDIDKIADALVGLGAYESEQTLSTCIGKDAKGAINIDQSLLWDRKCKAIEQTKGLTIYRGKETYSDIGGCDNAKYFFKKVLNGKYRYRAVLFIDEIEKGFAAVGSDTSGVSQDQHQHMLTWMEDLQIDGVIEVGPPGCAKSAFAKATGNEGTIPTICFDIGAMKNQYVGKSGELIRGATKIVTAISQGQVLVIATCNSISSLPPELKRRFKLGTFYFDLPTTAERKLIWDIYTKKLKLNSKLLDKIDDTGWTGAEIRQACNLVERLDIKLSEASRYIVPVCKSAADQIENLRRLADGKFIDASKAGIYQRNTANKAAERSRKMQL